LHVCTYTQMEHFSLNFAVFTLEVHHTSNQDLQFRLGHHWLEQQIKLRPTCCCTVWSVLSLNSVYIVPEPNTNSEDPVMEKRWRQTGMSQPTSVQCHSLDHFHRLSSLGLLCYQSSAWIMNKLRFPSREPSKYVLVAKMQCHRLTRLEPFAFQQARQQHVLVADKI